MASARLFVFVLPLAALLVAGCSDDASPDGDTCGGPCRDGGIGNTDGGSVSNDSGTTALDGGGGTQDGGGSTADSGTTSSDASTGNDYCPVVGYASCGGDLLGTWAFRALCPEDPQAAAALCEHPYDNLPICTGTGNEAICDGQITGTLTFKSDGNVDVATETTLITTWNFTDDCLAAAAQTGSTPQERCAGMGTTRLTCTYAGHCTCVGDPIVESDTNTATYAVMGNDVTLGGDPPASYCIVGDTLTMDYYVYHPISWRYWVMERQ